MLAWDVVVINGYLFINAYVVSYLLFSKYRGRVPDKRWYLPVLLLGVVWAVGIHTIPAFLYASLGGRPFWHSAVLAPRFLASAFVSGPSLLIIALTVVRDQMHFPVREEALQRLRQIVGVAAVLNLFLTVSEIFVEIYPGTSHSASMRYILVGLHGHNLLVPYIWTGIALSVFAAVVFLARPLYSRPKLLLAACAGAVIGVWIEKGMGLVIPGFIPTSLGEIVEYSPSFIEFCVSAGIWAIGAFLYTLMLKVAVPIELGTLRRPGASQRARRPRPGARRRVSPRAVLLAAVACASLAACDRPPPRRPPAMRSQAMDLSAVPPTPVAGSLRGRGLPHRRGLVPRRPHAGPGARRPHLLRRPRRPAVRGVRPGARAPRLGALPGRHAARARSAAHRPPRADPLLGALRVGRARQVGRSRRRLRGHRRRGGAAGDPRRPGEDLLRRRHAELRRGSVSRARSVAASSTSTARARASASGKEHRRRDGSGSARSRVGIESSSGAAAALCAACAEVRPVASVAPTFERDVRPALEARCGQCHGARRPAAGWSASRFTDVIACIPGSADGGVPDAGAWPSRLAAALARPDHQGLLDDAQRALIARWIAGGAPAARGAMHPPGFSDPRSADFHARALRSQRWAPMLDATRAEVLRPLPRGLPDAPRRGDGRGRRRAVVHELSRAARRSARLRHLSRRR
jgi:formate-dependent nitrite reductase membrane component NrfD